MTKKELSQLYYLKKEIRHLEQRIKELETAPTDCTTKITGLPHGTDINDKIGNYAAQIADLKSLLDLNLKKCFYELNRVNRFISNVQNSEIRLILTLRYTQNLSWKNIAFTMNYQDESVPRKRHDRFLRKIKMTDLSETKVL